MATFPLPTDNLYKFCALTGVIVLVLFTWQALILNNEYSAKQIEFTAAGKRIEVEQAMLKDAVDDVTAQLDDIQRDIARGNAATEKIKHAKLKHDESVRLSREQQQRAIDFEATASKIELLTVHRNQLIGAALFVYLAAGSLAFYGFRNWRTLQQKQDDLLDLQLAEARKK